MMAAPEILYRVVHDRSEDEQGTTYYSHQHGIIPGAFLTGESTKGLPRETYWRDQAELQMNSYNKRPTEVSSWCSELDQAFRIGHRQLGEHRNVQIIAVRPTDLKNRGIGIRCSADVDVCPHWLKEPRPWEWLVKGPIPADIVDDPYTLALMGTQSVATGIECRKTITGDEPWDDVYIVKKFFYSHYSKKGNPCFAKSEPYFVEVEYEDGRPSDEWIEYQAFGQWL